jgi:hypothetical protein
MSAAKFDRLIDLIVNEDHATADQLFHDIIVEKSREIYESIIGEDAVGNLFDEIDTISSEEESGMTEEFEEEGEDFGGEEEFGAEDEEGVEGFGDEDLDAVDAGEGMDEEDLEDRVVDLEDKLEQLMAEFESEMSTNADSEEEFGGDDEADFGGEEDLGDEFGDEEGEEDLGDEMMESVQLKQVGGKTYDKFGKMGDNGDQTKSPTLQNPKRLETGGKPVQFDGAESVPTSAKKPSNYATKGQGEEDFGNINKVGGNAGKTAFKTKAPAPKNEDPGKSKSPVAESRKTVKRRI